MMSAYQQKCAMQSHCKVSASLFYTFYAHKIGFSVMKHFIKRICMGDHFQFGSVFIYKNNQIKIIKKNQN